jgi:hypothetical protein
MEKIVNFLEARRKFEIEGLVSALKWEQRRDTPPEPEKPYTGPTKRPLIVSALPGEPIPPEFPDFRPFLQRDGLILLGWSRWDREELGVCYRVNWVKSTGTLHSYSSGGFIYDISNEREMSKYMPSRNGDTFWRDGIAGRPFSLINIHNEDVADYVFVCAPWDLNRRTIPGFIGKLKASGIMVDFDFPYSMDYVKKLEFAAALQECKVTPPHPCVRGKVGL